MTDMTFAVSNDNQKFYKVVDLFFGMNPSNKFWILYTLLFAKRDWLRIIDNYDGSEGFELAKMDAELITHKAVADEWMSKGIHSKSAVAVIPKESCETISFLLNTFGQLQEVYSNRVVDGNIFKSDLASSDSLFKVTEGLLSLSKEWYANFSNEAFLGILYRIQRFAGRASGEFMQPTELTSFMTTLLNVKAGTVYNPFSGVCSFGIDLPNGVKYVSQEIALLPYVIGLLNMLFHEKANYKCLQEDSVTNWAGSQEFDYIIANPPFRGRIEGEYRYSDVAYLVKSALSAKEVSVGVYATSICFSKRKEEQDALKTIVSNDLIDTVVLLPEGIFAQTSIPSVVIKTSRCKKTPGYVKLIDGSKCFKTRARQRVLDLDALNKLMYQEEQSEEVAMVSIEEIITSEYNVFPLYYLYKAVSNNETGAPMVKLGDIMRSAQLSRVSSSNGRVFSLSNANSTKIVLGDNLQVEELDKPQIYRTVSQDTMLVSRAGSFKAYYLRTEVEVCVRDVFSGFVLNTDVVDPQYLLSEFGKDYFAKQVERYGKGTMHIGRYMSTAAFLNCMVELPSLSAQRRSILKEGQEAYVQELHRLEKSYESKLNEFMLGQRQRKHAVQQVLNEILPSVELVKDFVESNEQVDGSSILSRRFGKSLNDYLCSMHKQVLKVIDMVDNFTIQESFGEPEEIDLYSFLDEYCSFKNTNDTYQAVYEREGEELDEGEESSELFVRIARRDLTQMLDNLFANAVKYGFTDKNKHDYQIVFKPIRVSGQPIPMVELHILNNGVPASATTPINKIFTWGIGQGTGIGCWQVKTIAEHFGGSVTYNELADTPDGFVCEFTICLPLIEK